MASDVAEAIFVWSAIVGARKQLCLCLCLEVCLKVDCLQNKNVVNQSMSRRCESCLLSPVCCFLSSFLLLAGEATKRYYRLN